VGKNLLHIARYDFSHGNFVGYWLFGWHEKFLPVSDDILCQQGTKLSEDCYKYGGENIAGEGNLAKAASLYGGALAHIEREFEDLNKLLASQV